MALIKCPGCGADIDTEKQTAEFRQPQVDPPDDQSGDPPPAPAPRQRGNAFFKPRRKE